MKVFKATLGIDMSITTLIIGTLCQDRKGEDTGYDHQHLKDNLQKHDDNTPGCYQKSDEINNGKDGDYQALACARSTLLSESRHRLAIICYKSIKNPRDGKVANPQKMTGKNQITFMRTHATFCGFRQKQIKTFCGFRQNKVKTFCGFRQKLYLCTHNQLIIRQIWVQRQFLEGKYIKTCSNGRKSVMEKRHFW